MIFGEKIKIKYWDSTINHMDIKKSLAKFCIMKKVRDKANETDE